jgi:hypothetical protein
VPLTFGILTFLVPVGIALGRARVQNATSVGIRLALLYFFSTAVLGIWMAHGFSGMRFPGSRMLWSQVHLSVALLGWVGGLILAVWFLHPTVCLRNLAGRKRKRVDWSLRFWQLGLATAPMVGAAAIAAYFLTDPRWDLLFGWLALLGWAGTIVHGMLTRIVPFLVWLHRFAPRIGEIRVPSVKKILPEALARRGFALHAITLYLGVAAILSGVDWLARLTGLLMAVTALALAHMLVHVARQGPERRGLMSGPPAE